jgi:hypothetical protein
MFLKNNFLIESGHFLFGSNWKKYFKTGCKQKALVKSKLNHLKIERFDCPTKISVQS